MFKLLLLIPFLTLAGSSYFNSASLMQDSGSIRAFIGQSTPFSPTVETGSLFFLDPKNTPRPLSVVTSRGNFPYYLGCKFSIPSSVSSVIFKYIPIGSIKDTSVTLTLLDSSFNAILDSTLIPNGFTGHYRIYDTYGNFYSLPVVHNPLIVHNWILNPDRWYSIKPTHYSRNFLKALSSRPNFFDKMKKDQLVCYYRNSAFVDFSPSDTLELPLCEAFFVYLKFPFSFTDTLSSIFSDSLYAPISHTLRLGWNIISTPFNYNIAIGNIIFSDTVSPLFGVTDSSNATTTYYKVFSRSADSSALIEPFKGYWVYSFKSNTTVAFLPYEKPVLNKKAISNNMILQVSNNKSSILLGRVGGGMKIKSPPLSNLSSLNTENGYSVLFKPISETNFISRLFLEKGGPHTFSLKSFSDSQSVIYVADIDSVFSLSNNSNLTLPSNDYSVIYFLSGTPEFIALNREKVKLEYPSEIVFSDNYPNPFNPVTTIRYGVPFKSKNSALLFKVYDIKGRLIYYNKIIPGPGYGTISWHGKDNSGRSAGSGLFVGRLTVNNTTKTIKMVVVK